ncbi:MAG: hypothetical protein JSV26_05670 [bacterium]|nr:MAG: hypothetical protein JSV26_05670 [bacterium]
MRERISTGRRWIGPGRRMHHWFFEDGMPGWTRPSGGYPCLHWADTHIPAVFDRRHELELLKEEAQELEQALGDVRKTISELEGKGSTS